MKELNKEEQLKVFAMYWGCEYSHCHSAGDIDYINKEFFETYVDEDLDYILNDPKLHLTPLSEITDEHAVMMYHLYCGIIAKYDYTMDFHGLLKAAILWLTKGGLDEISKYTVTCELAKKLCYAVPLFFEPNHWANGKTAIELGIAISKNEVKH